LVLLDGFIQLFVAKRVDRELEVVFLRHVYHLTTTYYSYRRASIGLRIAARYAGYRPKIKPVPTEVLNPTATQNIETLAGREGATVRMTKAMAPPVRMPRMPPTAVKTIASNRNCIRIFRWVAPMA